PARVLGFGSGQQDAPHNPIAEEDQRPGPEYLRQELLNHAALLLNRPAATCRRQPPRPSRERTNKEKVHASASPPRRGLVNFIVPRLRCKRSTPAHRPLSIVCREIAIRFSGAVRNDRRDP